MFSQTLKIIDTYIEKFCDGTLQTTDHLCASDRERLTPLCAKTRTGFLQIRNADLESKTMDDYKKIVLDDGNWARFVATKLNSYFGETVDLTPLGMRDAAVTEADEQPDPDGHMTPEMLIRLSLGRIERQFPGGEGVDFGDQDLRDLISAKGLVVYDNFKHLHAARRINIVKLYRFALAASTIGAVGLVTTALFPLPLSGLWVMAPIVVLAGGTVAAFHAASILTRRRHRMLNDHFNAATRLSSATVSKCAILRQDTIIFACHHMFEIANTGKEDYWAQGKLKRWTEVNEKWCELIFWLNGRVTANTNYAFIRTKLIGMALDGLRAEAQFESLKMTSLYLAGLTVTSLTALGAIAFDVWHLAAPWQGAVFLAFATYMAWQVLRLYDLIRVEDTPEAVEEILNADSLRTMKGHKDARLHEEVAHFMKREKLKQLYAERTRLNSGVLNDVVGAEVDPLPHDA